MPNNPVTLFTGQWADKTFENLCQKAAEWGYEGLEIACWGDHMNVGRAAEDKGYINSKKQILEINGLKCWALGEMKSTAKAAKNMGCTVVNGFMGSPIWKAWYSFPPTTEAEIEKGFALILKLWTPIFDEFDRQGIRFALEVHPTEIAFDFYTARRLLETFDFRPTLGFNFDPSHLLWQGMEPHLFIREFPDRIYHVHMKDVSVTLDGKAGILGSFLPFGDLRRGWNFRKFLPFRCGF